jgi:hypothetical protein
MSWFSEFRGGDFIGAFSEALDLAKPYPMPTLLEGSGPSKSKSLSRLTFGGSGTHKKWKRYFCTYKVRPSKAEVDFLTFDRFRLAL